MLERHGVHVHQRYLHRVLRQTARPRSRVLAQCLDSRSLIEEENVPDYDPKRFYPAKIGDVLNNRYQLDLKLGFGVGSTVWLARDLHRFAWQSSKYAAIKICVASDREASEGKDTAGNELSILHAIEAAKTQHGGSRFVRKLVDSFTLPGQAESLHQCLVFDPTREPLNMYRTRYPGRVMSSFFAKVVIKQILHGLDFLHSTCHIVHTDLKLDNLMVEAESQDIFTKEIQAERDHPRPQKICEDGRVIYLSRSDFGIPQTGTGWIQIADFGYSVIGGGSHHGAIQAEVYRAPEVILGAAYTYSADIWNLGVLIWDLLQGQPLFHDAEASKSGGVFDEGYHVGLMTALLGPAPAELLSKGSRTDRFYTTDWQLQDDIAVPEGFTWESCISTLSGKDKDLFIAFAKRMITWSPEDRATAKELLEDPWVHYKEHA